MIAGDTCPILQAESLHIQREMELEGKHAMDIFDEDFTQILRDAMPEVVEHKFGKVAMSRWCQFVVLVRQLVFQWSRRFFSSHILPHGRRRQVGQSQGVAQACHAGQVITS